MATETVPAQAAFKLAVNMLVEIVDSADAADRHAFFMDPAGDVLARAGQAENWLMSPVFRRTEGVSHE